MSRQGSPMDAFIGQALRHGMSQPQPIRWQGQPISGPAKVAVVLTCLDVPEAARAMLHFSNEDALRVASMISSVHTLDRELVIQVLEEFRLLTRHEYQIAFDAESFLRDLIARFTVESALESKLRGNVGHRIPALEAISGLSSADLHEHLRQEHPQVSATLLAMLDAKQSAAVLELFEPDLRNELLLRIAVLNRVDPALLSDFNDLLVKSMQNENRIGSTALGGTANVAEILGYFPTGAARDLVEQIRQIDQNLGHQIAEQMFVFEDFLQLNPEALRRVLDETPVDVLVLALKGADANVREHFFQHMSTRTSERVRFEIEITPPVQVQAMEATHRELIVLARRLADEGVIDLTLDAVRQGRG